MKIKLLIILLLVTVTSFANVTLVENEVQRNEFTISPNPAKNKLKIKLSSTDEVKLEVFDVLGKRVYNGVLTQLESSVDISSWKNGVYLVRISNDKTTQTKRFIKQ